MNKLTDVNYYVSEFQGNLIPHRNFDKYNVMASNKVNYFTRGRIISINDKIQSCVCRVAELLYKQDAIKQELSKGLVQSETVSSHNVTFDNSNRIKNTMLSNSDLNKEIYNICLEELALTNLMYRGI